MQKIDRIAIVVKGKQPLVDWINSHDTNNQVCLDDVRTDCNVLLIPDGYDPQEAIEMVEKSYQAIFISEIEGWYTDESLWPADITVEKFRQWFDLEYHSMLFDVMEEDIQKEQD